MAFANLPVELLHEVCQLVDRSDARNLRLVCRNLYPVASAYAMRELVFFPNEHDLQFLQDMARHPLYHEQVRSLVCVAVPPTFAPMRETWQDFHERFRDLEWQFLDAVADPDGPDHARPNPRQEEHVRHWYGMFERTWHEQDELFRQRRDYEAIRDVIGRLPNLSEVTLSRPDSRLYYQPEWALFYHRVSSKPFGQERSDGRADCRNVWAVLDGLHDAGTQLKALRLGSLPWEFLDHQGIGLDDLGHLFGCISEFQLYVTGLRNDDGEELISPQLVGFRKSAANGVLRAAIASMPNLAEVDLEFHEELNQVTDFEPYLLESESRLRVQHPVSWEDLFTPGQAWLNLQSLRLQGVAAHRRQLVTFLEGQPNLVCLRLLDMDLGATSWLRLLPRMKMVLGGTRSCTVELGGQLWGTSEDGEGVPEQWNLYKPGVQWGPGPIAVAVSKYFRGPDNIPCPLTTANTYRFDYGPELRTHKWDYSLTDEEVEQWGAIIRECPTTLEV